MLDGTEGSSTTFEIIAKYDWKIIDYRGFTCTPSSGSKSIDNERIKITATTLHANNSADTVRLSDLNFKLLNTRFVGVAAYQLPQISIKGGKTVGLNAVEGATATATIVSKAEDITLKTSGDITATLGERNNKNEYKITITATTSNNTTESQVIGNVEFIVDGVVQGSKIEVIQQSAIVFDRSVVLLPGRAGASNMFEVQSEFDIEASEESGFFSIEMISKNSFRVTATYDNTASSEQSLGNIEISLREFPDCRASIEVCQRIAKAPQTIIINFIGTALLNPYFTTNINNILKALNDNIQDSSQIVAICTESKNSASLYEYRYDKILGKAVKEKIKELTLPTPYNAVLFESNLREALNFAPADKYALLIGSHGLGWIPKSPSATFSRTLKRLGISPAQLWERDQNAEMTRHLGDKGSAVQYDITEVATAIEANNIKFDYILFDACLMGNIESAYELRNATHHIIASPCEVMGYGFPYQQITKYMLMNGGKEYDLDKICKEYVNYYETEAVTPSACVAVTHTDKLEALAQAMKAVNQAGIKADFSLDNVQYYEGQDPHSFYDLGDLVEQSCADSAVAAAFKEQLDKTVTSRYHTKKFYSGFGANNKYYFDINYYSGISTSAMVEHYSTDWQQTAWYKATH